MEQNLSSEAVKNLQLWLDNPKYQAYRSKIQALIDQSDWKTLEDSFYKHIEFGTAGMRGTTGVGPANINTITIGEAAQAVADYLNGQTKQPSVVIAYDTRISSVELSQITASVLAANHIKVYYFESFRSTPELSFAIRHLHASAGIVISASHNPPADNGFKVYWEDGAQVSSPADQGLLETFAKVENIKTGDFDDFKDQGQIELIGLAVDTAYQKAILNTNQTYTHFDETLAPSIKIAYSPLHGAGQTSALPILREAGFNVVTVDAEMVPDGHFPALANNIANPEVDSANQGVLDLMASTDCDLGLTTDPDADRLRITIKTEQGPIAINGNQSGALATDYLLSKNPNGYICKTIVTTDLIDAIAAAHHTTIYNNFLIGFKYIGRQIHRLEDKDDRFILGAEESYGMLVGTDARDKDAATGALVLAEYAAELKAAGKTLYDRLLELFIDYGIFVETQLSAVYPGAEGFTTMKNVMQNLRDNPPEKIADQKITRVIDCLEASTPTADPGNVIILEFNDDHRQRITIRPSGTEPKLKFYGQWYAAADLDQDIETQYHATLAKTQSLLEALKAFALQA